MQPNRQDFQGVESQAEKRSMSCASSHSMRWVLQVLGLGIVVAVIYGARISTVPIRGEESRWARVAQEMIDSGDWITPRQQGKVFPNRPPLNSWCIAATSLVVGDTSPFAVRLPTLLATVLTALLVALYTRNFLGSGASLTAGLIYATFPQILQLGRFAESDALLTLFITGSLFVWHYGFLRGWSPWLLWSAGYSLAALAALTKGPQGPVYFVGVTCLYLGLRSDWRRLFSWGHVVGLALMLLLVGAWQIPYALNVGAEASLKTWCEEGALAQRIAEAGSGRFFSHLLAFPLEIFAVMLPWALFVPELATRNFWRERENGRDWVIFLLVIVLVVLAPCWIIPSAGVRYVMALFPVAACLSALAVDSSLKSAKNTSSLRRWSWFHGVFAVGMTGLGVAAITLACTVSRATTTNVPEGLQAWFQSAPLPSSSILAAFGCVSLATAIASFFLARKGSLHRPLWAVLPAALLLCAGYDGPILDYLIISNPNAPLAIARIKAEIPAGESLASFGPVIHLFTYAYRDPVELREWPSPAMAAKDIPDYFCFMQTSAEKSLAIPVPWEKVGEVVCDRYRRENPREVVVVGRRIFLPQLANAPNERK
ncbi:MAG: glycosyltransferase family 39 protein [Planctomycetota bacterium]